MTMVPHTAQMRDLVQSHSELLRSDLRNQLTSVLTTRDVAINASDVVTVLFYKLNNRHTVTFHVTSYIVTRQAKIFNGFV